jgi:hypothetical protein
MLRTTAMRATKKIDAYLGIFQTAKNCEDNMIKMGKMAVADKDCNNASMSKEDDNVQETRGNDEEAGPNDEGDSNVARSDTIHDNKVVASGDNGGIIRVREDDSNANNNSAGSGDEEVARNNDNDGDG